VPSWDRDQYLRFSSERTRPCRDLAAQIEVSPARRIVDLGCGPGNSVEVLATRFPDAEFTGLDNSPGMLEAAGKTRTECRWVLGDIAEWAQGSEGDFDIVFSNAALHWIRDHASVVPRLLAHARPGGALAVQFPANTERPAHRLMREIALSPRWNPFLGSLSEIEVHEADFYYDVLAPHADRVNIWEQVYLHVLPGPEAIVEWYKGAGLRPYLDLLGEQDRESFTAEYLKAIEGAYPRRRDGRVLLQFRRIFIVAYRRP
jgi:trans-aconitate 2-methyltransferase